MERVSNPAGLPDALRVAERALDFGAQGGDPGRGVSMDLSTCVNRYGPAPAALEGLRSIRPMDILLHPYDAQERLKAVYEWATGVDGDDLVAGRGRASSSGR